MFARFLSMQEEFYGKEVIDADREMVEMVRRFVYVCFWQSMQLYETHLMSMWCVLEF